MKRKWISVSILLILLASIPLTGCASSASRAVIAEEGTPRPLPICEPRGTPEPERESGVVPYDYEVTATLTDRDTETEITFPIARLTLQNTDNQSGEFIVLIYFYALDKFTGDSQKTTLDLPGTKTVRERGRQYKYEQAVNLASGASQTVNFAVPEIDMFEDYWYWRYEIVPPIKASTGGPVPWPPMRE